MSYINLMVIKNKKVCFFCCDYKTALALFAKGFDRVFELAKRQNFIDAGWLVVDFDNSAVVSRQDAFPASRLKDWNVFEL